MAKRIASKKVADLQPTYINDEGFKAYLSKEFMYEKMTFTQKGNRHSLIDSKTVTLKEPLKKLSSWEKDKDGSQTFVTHLLISAPSEWLMKNKYYTKDE